ncbi:MAG: YcbK family protein [Deltaproteobacteria bacterium]|nr:YcbK family protein [Deltaproteobacteria bacterium]
MRQIFKYLFLLGIFIAIPWPGSSSPIPTAFPKGDGVITLYDLHSGEKAAIRYRLGKNYLEAGLEQINYLLRCRADGKIKPMHLELVELVDHLEDHFESGEVRVLSGYRSPEFNHKLRRRGRRAAKYSRHMKGEAIDLRLPGVSAWRLRQYLAALKVGGVGYYPGRSFVHVDVGPYRTW